MFLPTDIAQEALDAALLDITVSDIEEGSRAAQVLARKYRPCLAALLRGAHWRFARKQAAMTMLGDVTGTIVTSTLVIPPWTYEYALPNDCVQAHFVPYAPLPSTTAPSGNIAIPSTPLTTAPSMAQIPGGRLIPSRFLIARDSNYPPEPGQEYWNVQGQSMMGQTVILSDVPYAQIVYTSLVLTPSEWDSLFREAMVAYLSAEICVLHGNAKEGMAVRRDQLAIAKAKIAEARVANANDGWNVTDHVPDWIAARRGGGRALGWNGGDGGGPGYFYQGYGAVNFGDGGAAY